MKLLRYLVPLLLTAPAFGTVVTLNTSVSFTCTGTRGPFPFNFSVSGANAITVTKNGGILSPNAYVVTPVNNNYDNGGSVLLNGVCPNAQPLVISRTTPLTQTTVYTDNMPTPMKTIENSVDKLTEIVQELAVTSGGSGTFNALTGDAVSTATGGATTVKGVNGTLLSGLATGIYKNTTGTGVPSIATGADVIALWTASCGILTYLRGDGVCATPAGGGNVTAGGSLVSNQIVLGQGGTAVATLGTVGTTTTVLHGNAGGAPTFGAVNLGADVTGNLPVGNLAGGSGASGSTFWRGDGTWALPAGSISGGVIGQAAIFGSTSSITGSAALAQTKNAISNQYLNSYNAASGIFTATQPGFGNLSGQATNAQLATQTANTVLGALTATTPSGLALPSCSGVSNALTWTTSTGFGCNTISGGGGGGITGLTLGFIPLAGSATTLTANSALDDSITTPATITSSEPMTAPNYNTNGTVPGNIKLTAGAGSISALPANSAGFAAPVTGGTAFLYKLPATAVVGLLHAAAPATADGVNESALTSSLVAIADLSATGTPSSTTFLRGDNTWASSAACGTCVTSAASLTSGAIMTGAGGQASQTNTTGTGVVTALGVNTGTAGAFGVLIASGTSALGTSSIASGACATVVTTTATGAASTDAIIWNPNASIKAVTGYVPATTGGLSIAGYPTTNAVNWDVCNWSSLSITPGAVTLNWRIIR